MSPEMRIAGGIWKGRKIASFAGGYRPTAGIVKKSLFDTIGKDIEGSRFLDLFAGTGAVGLEAVSRGAGHVCFIENDNSRVNVLKRNIEKLGVEGEVSEVLALDYSRALQKLGNRGETFDFIYIDPPYDGVSPQRILRRIVESRVLETDGLLIFEGSRKGIVDILKSAPEDLYPVRERLLGSSALAFFIWRESAKPDLYKSGDTEVSE